MAKRLSRKRLFAINAKGQDLANTAGPGIVSNIGSQTRSKDGSMITTEFQIDLAAAAGAASSFTYNGDVGVAGAYSAIGVSSSVSNGVGIGHANAQLLQVNITGSALDGLGLLTSGELVCVETPAGGGIHIGLCYGTNVSGSGESMGNGGVIMLTASAQSKGTDNTFDVDADLDDKYIYLCHSGSGAAAYTSGKFVLRLFGYNEFANV
jgi:hypothetical protein